MRQVVINKKVVQCLLLGTWMMSSHLKNPETDSCVCYSPPAQLLTENVEYTPHPPMTLPATKPDELRALTESEITKLSYAAVAKAANTTEATVIYVLKQVLVALVATKDYSIKLNVRVGLLKFTNMKLEFESVLHASDKVTITSCNSAFRNNKRDLTNLRSPRAEEESVRDTISKATAQTPKSRATSLVRSIASKTSSFYHAANPNP